MLAPWNVEAIGAPQRLSPLMVPALRLARSRLPRSRTRFRAAGVDRRAEHAGRRRVPSRPPFLPTAETAIVRISPWPVRRMSSHRWLLPLAPGSGRTKSSPPSAPAAWARSTRRATRVSTAMWRSRSCPPRCPAKRRHASGSCARRGPRLHCPTPTSARSTMSARPAMGASSWSWSCCTARPCSSGRRRVRSTSLRSWTPASPWLMLSRRRMRLASCIATSSRRTSS